MVTTRKDNDAFGQMLLAQYKSGGKLCEIIEREDNYIDTGSRPGSYLSEFKDWWPSERQAIKLAKGRVLDIGCGGGRHSVYLQDKGLDVTGIDTSPGAIKVCKLRGLKKAILRSIDDVSKFRPKSFDTVLMLGNNFGLVRSPDGAHKFLKDLSRITSDDALIIAGTRNPYGTTNPLHFGYHKFNRSRGRLPGQLTIRARFGVTVGEWFDYLLVSPQEMEKILEGTGWEISRLIGPTNESYFAIVTKSTAS
jgi:SAM-dependent methyltransferase